MIIMTHNDLLAELIAKARAAGADAADAVLVAGTSLGVQRRLGKTEHLERAEGRDLGLRVFVGQRSANRLVDRRRSRRISAPRRTGGGDGEGGAGRPVFRAGGRGGAARGRSTSTSPTPPNPTRRP